MSAEQESEEGGFSPSIEGARSYLETKLPAALAVGSVVGASVGYYVGDMAALYTTTYGLGLGLGGTAFYCGTYGLKCFRKTDDI